MIRKEGKKVLILIAVCIMCYIAVYILLCPRSGMIKEFYKLEDNTVDVLVVGSSNAFANFNPAVLWQQYGISSYNLGGSGQPIWNTYYYLREAYKTQSPQLVVLEVYTMASYQSGYDELSNVPSNTLSLKWSKNKVECMWNSTRSKDFVDLCLGLPVFHNRWTEMFQDGNLPWDYDNCNGAIQKGFHPVFFYETKEQQTVNTTIREALSEKNREYLQKIIDLTRERGSKLLLVKTPYVLGEKYDAIFNSVADLAKQNGIPFINMNECADQMGFDFTRNMADIVHLNNVGVYKVTNYLGRMIKEQYSIPDRKGDRKYDTWQKYSDLYKETLFMCPEIVRKKRVASYSDNILVEKINDRLFMAMFPVELQKDTYYRIEVNTNLSRSIEGIVDIFGEAYDFSDQKRRIFLGSEMMDHNFVIIKTREEIPEKLYVRIYSSEADMALSKVRIDRLRTVGE